MIDLSDYTDNLRRAVARPGTFTTLFPETVEADLAATLADGFAEAQLDGVFGDFAVDDDGLVTPVKPGGADISTAQIALVVLYAAVRIIRAELMNRAQHRKYVGAGGVTFEEDYSTNLLRDILASLITQKTRLADAAAEAALNAGGGAGFYMGDQYAARIGLWS